MTTAENTISLTTVAKTPFTARSALTFWEAKLLSLLMGERARTQSSPTAKTARSSAELKTIRDVSDSGGSLSNWKSASATSCYATFTPTTYNTTHGIISVASSKFSDSAGNTNIKSSTPTTLTLSLSIQPLLLHLLA